MANPYVTNGGNPYGSPAPVTQGTAPVGAAGTGAAGGTGVFANQVNAPENGTAGTYQPGAPNDPASTQATNYGAGAAGANANMLAYLNSVGNNFSSIPGEVDKLNAQYGLGSGQGLSWYPGKNVVAAS